MRGLDEELRPMAWMHGRTGFSVGSALLCVALLAPLGGEAAGACRDVPSFETLECRMAELGDVASGVNKKFSRVISRVSRRVDQGTQACAEANTPRARNRLRQLRRPLEGARRQLDRAVDRGDLIQPEASEIEGMIRFVDSLRRATLARLERSPCPEWVDILSPVRGEVAADDQVLLLFEISAEANPSSIEVQLESPGGETSLALTALSESQGWTRVDCVESGPHTLRVSVSRIADGQRDEQSVSFQCGVSGFTLGAEIELLIDWDFSPETLRASPVRPLRSGATYAVVVTRDLRARRGGRVVASAAFRAEAGLGGEPSRGVEAFYAADPNDPRNPFPSSRTLRPDGTVRIPDGFTARAVPDVPRLAGVRAFLRGLDRLSEEHVGFSPSSTVVLSFGEEIRLHRVTAENVFLVEIANPGVPGGGSPLPILLDALEQQRGIPAEDVALASVFPVENLRGVLETVREQTASRAVTSPPTPDFVDPDPNAGPIFGIFRPGDPEFGSFFGGSPPATVGVVARGRFPSPEYRENGRYPERFLDGSEVPPHLDLDFRLVLPVGDPPPGGFPTVILQHGFAGSNSFVTDSAADFCAAGLAVIGISAPEHGLRGLFLNYFNFDDFNAFGNNFRQSSVDLFQLTQLIVAGIDVDDDSISELRPTEIGFLGVSLGGLIGAVLGSTEPEIRVSVLNVPGGRLAQFAGSTSGLALPFLVRFAEQSGIPVRTCQGEPTGDVCTDDGQCAAECRLNDDFVLMLNAALPNFQVQLDPGDGINYARGFRIEPRGEDPEAVLIQEGLGDGIVANPLTEALARSIGLPVNRPDMDTLGVAGLWRFPPPEGHGIFGLAEVRAQAILFLTSGGEQISTP